MLDYENMFAEARAELEKLHAQKAEQEAMLSDTSAKIDAMTKTYNAIAPIVGQQGLPDLLDSVLELSMDALKAAGISVAVRATLDKFSQEDFTAASLRDRLASLGWDWEKYKNALPTIHTTLVRLVDSGAALPATTPDGKKAFYSSRRVAKKATPVGHGLPPLPSGIGRYHSRSRSSEGFSIPGGLSIPGEKDDK